LLLIHLPDGPTAYFRLTSIRTRKQLGDDLAHTVGKNPELILNNFTTRLGHSVGRMFAALFPQNPEVSTHLYSLRETETLTVVLCLLVYVFGYSFEVEELSRFTTNEISSSFASIATFSKNRRTRS
jgi:rRNA maturation protein Rpf1